MLSRLLVSDFMGPGYYVLRTLVLDSTSQVLGPGAPGLWVAGLGVLDSGSRVLSPGSQDPVSLGPGS